MRLDLRSDLLPADLGHGLWALAGLLLPLIPPSPPPHQWVPEPDVQRCRGLGCASKKPLLKVTL